MGERKPTPGERAREATARSVPLQHAARRSTLSCRPRSATWTIFAHVSLLQQKDEFVASNYFQSRHCNFQVGPLRFGSQSCTSYQYMLFGGGANDTTEARWPLDYCAALQIPSVARHLITKHTRGEKIGRQSFPAAHLFILRTAPYGIGVLMTAGTATWGPLYSSELL